MHKKTAGPGASEGHTGFMASAVLSKKTGSLRTSEGSLSLLRIFQFFDSEYFSPNHFRKAVSALSIRSRHSGVISSPKSKDSPSTLMRTEGGTPLPRFRARERSHPGPNEWMFRPSRRGSGAISSILYLPRRLRHSTVPGHRRISADRIG